MYGAETPAADQTPSGPAVDAAEVARTAWLAARREGLYSALYFFHIYSVLRSAGLFHRCDELNDDLKARTS